MPATSRSRRTPLRPSQPHSRLAPSRSTDDRRAEIAEYLRAAIVYVDGMSDFLTVTLRQRGVAAPRAAAPRITDGADVAEVVDTLKKADAFAASCAAGLSRFIGWSGVTPEIWEACWRGAARGWSSLTRTACRRCADANHIDPGSVPGIGDDA